MQIINKNKLPQIRTRVNTSLLNRSDDMLSYQNDSLHQFYMEVKERNDLKKSQERKKSEQKKYKILSQLQKRNESQLLQCRKEIIKLKDELKEERKNKLKTQSIHNVQGKLNKAYTDLKLSELQKKLIQNQHSTLQPPTPYMNPHPWNSPFYPPQYRYSPFPLNDRRKQSRKEEEEPEKKVFHRRKLKKKGNLIKSFENKKRKELKRKFKAAVWAVVFALKIPEYNKKIIKVRKQMLQNFHQKPFAVQMTSIQKWIVEKIRELLANMMKKDEIELQPLENDTSTMKEEKVNEINKLIWMLLKCLDKFNGEEEEKELIEILHLFCKHGCFICSNLMTKEQLALTTVSDIHGYLRLTKEMQKSQILSFLFIKILVYNTLITPEKIDSQKFNKEKTILRENMFLIGSIFYRMCTDLQEDLIDSVSQENYPLNNWEKYEQKFTIEPCSSLSLPNKELEEGQLISGLYSAKKIDEICGKKAFKKEKRKLKEVVEKYHKSICRYHKKLLNKIKF